MRIHFTIPIEPRAQKRARAVHASGHTWTHKSPDQSKYEAKVSALIAQYRPEKPFEGAIELTVVGYFPIPVSKPKKWKTAALAGQIRHTKKPDCTNIAKNIEDIMNGVFWRDDSQVAPLHVDKFYSENPRWEITLEERADNA